MKRATNRATEGAAVWTVALAVLLTSWAGTASADRTRQRPAYKKMPRVVRKARIKVLKLTRPLRPLKKARLNWKPASQKDFDIVGLVDSFQAKTPKRIVRKMKRASSRKLSDAHSVSFVQKVDDKLGAGPKKAAVHITRGTVNVPLGTFLNKMPADKWGVNLDHYLAGSVKVTKRDAKGRPVEQVERMVLSGLPGDANIRALNLDMTKVEKKVVQRDAAGKVKKVTMYWRVHDSANKTTFMDVGSVSFEAAGDNKTQVTFHSAHRLGKGKIQFPNAVVKPTLRSFFSDHVRHYRKLVSEK